MEVVTPDDTSYVSVEVCGEKLFRGRGTFSAYVNFKSNEGCAVQFYDSN